MSTNIIYLKNLTVYKSWPSLKMWSLSRTISGLELHMLKISFHFLVYILLINYNLIKLLWILTTVIANLLPFANHVG